MNEVIGPDETTRFEGYANELKALQAARTARRGAPARAVHVKQHVGVVGEFQALAPEGLRHGVFAKHEATYPAYVRFSNGSLSFQRDHVSDARGVAIKIVGVDGKKIRAGLEDKRTQDFLFINVPSLPFRDPDELVKFIRCAKDGPSKLLPRVLRHFGPLRGLSLLRRLASAAKVPSMATVPFYTAVPVRFGPAQAAKLALVPLSAAPATAGPSENMYRDDLIARVQRGPLGWSVRAQLFVDERTTPIEDASVLWPSPWVEIGKLTIPRQDPTSMNGKAIEALVESLSFDPWHALEDHRPLGSMMRARAVAYRESALGRKAADEPDTVLPIG